MCGFYLHSGYEIRKQNKTDDVKKYLMVNLIVIQTDNHLTCSI